jgi:malto-oligosyltrehalose trehalohydrolase
LSLEFQFGPTIRGDWTDFRLWAPGLESLTIEVEGHASEPMQRVDDGWWEVRVPCGPGARYRFRLPRGQLVPDPASRMQPEGVHGQSVVADPGAYAWICPGWRGRPWAETVLYELHVGLCGGFEGVAARLPALADLGVTAVELMPVGEFSGTRNWGYDGVLPFAPESAYGPPERLKALVDRAHSLGLSVFLDVVYNHFGPDGNWLPSYAPEFFREDILTPWGAAIDFRRPQVRRFFIENALYWLTEFRFDGLRLDAVHAISEPDFIAELAGEARAACLGREVHIVAENEHNDADLLRSGIDAQWNDDFHNALHVLLTGETHGYYQSFAEQPAEKLARALAQGFVYQGEPSPHHGGASRGKPSADLPPTAFVTFLQNHDQVGNRALGERLTTLISADLLRAAIALQLLCPQIPLIFMGEDGGAHEPFLFFTDFHDRLADAVREGRRREFAKFPEFADAGKRTRIPDPNAPATFEASRIHGDGAEWRALYRDLLALRRRIPGLPGARSLGAKAVGGKALVARWRLGPSGGRAVLTIACNVGDEPVRADLPQTQPIWGHLADGTLPAHTTAAWCEP